MLYLSSYLGRPVLDAANRPVGKVLDLVARLDGQFPLVWGIRVKTGKRQHRDVSWIDVRSFETTQVILSRGLDDLRPYSIGDNDVLLARNILDKQIVDLEGRRLIRVQDIQLSRSGTRLRVLGVDVSTSALLRRLRLSKIADRVARSKPPHSVAWSDVDLGSWHDPSVRLRVSREGLERLHPADLAEIASNLPAAEGIELLTILDDEVAADILEEMETDDQVRFLQALGPERAARVLERMSPDDAADLIKELDREDAAMLLAELDDESAAEISELLPYEEDTAGGLMTTEYLTVEPDQTAAQVGEHLREHTTDDMEPYERLLGEAMEGDTSLFAREDSVERGFPAWQVNRVTLQVVAALFGQGVGVIFAGGVTVRKVPETEIVEALFAEIDRLEAAARAS